MTAECEHSLAAWRDWQRLPDDEPLTPEVRQALRHIASCRHCVEELARVVASSTSQLAAGEKGGELRAFIAKERDAGSRRAAQAYPAAALSTLRNSHAFRRSYALQRALERASFRQDLPRDVAHSVRRQMEQINWVKLFLKDAGVLRDGGLASQPRAAVEFHINRVTKQAAFSTIPVHGLTWPHRTTQIQLDSAPVGPDRGRQQGPRAADVHTDTLNARVSIDPEDGRTRVVLSRLAAAEGGVPKVVIVHESGQSMTKTAQHGPEGYEVVFSGLESGDYVLAIDVIDKAKVRPTRPEPQGDVPEKTVPAPGTVRGAARKRPRRR